MQTHKLGRKRMCSKGWLTVSEVNLLQTVASRAVFHILTLTWICSPTHCCAFPSVLCTRPHCCFTDPNLLVLLTKKEQVGNVLFWSSHWLFKPAPPSHSFLHPIFSLPQTPIYVKSLTECYPLRKLTQFPRKALPNYSATSSWEAPTPSP